MFGFRNECAFILGNGFICVAVNVRHLHKNVQESTQPIASTLLTLESGIGIVFALN